MEPLLKGKVNKMNYQKTQATVAFIQTTLNMNALAHAVNPSTGVEKQGEVLDPKKHAKLVFNENKQFQKNKLFKSNPKHQNPTTKKHRIQQPVPQYKR